jgi:hypothetical protein
MMPVIVFPIGGQASPRSKYLYSENIPRNLVKSMRIGLTVDYFLNVFDSRHEVKDLVGWRKGVV